jgi:glycosyltransferase involved in cell wall biosynthesis
VPSYNQARFLDDTLHSILDQEYEPLELFVLDGGSTDGSLAIIERFASRLAFWRSAPDGGQSSAVREGLAMATGEIMGFVNSDDMLAPGSLAIVRRAFRNSDVQWVIGDVMLIDADGRPMRYLREPFWYRNWQIHVRNCVPQSSVFWRRDLYGKVQGLDSELEFCLDMDLWFQFQKLSEPKMLRQLLSYQRQHGNSKTSRIQHIRAKEYPIVLQRHLGYRPKTNSFLPLFWRVHRMIVKIFYGTYLVGWWKKRNSDRVKFSR